MSMATLSVRPLTRRYTVAAAVLAFVPLGVIAYRFASRGSVPAATSVEKQAPLVRMDVEVTSPTPSATVKIAGESHPLPFTGEIDGGASPIAVELTAPDHEGRTFRVVFDRPRRMSFALPTGSGLVEATNDELEHALTGDDEVIVMRPSNSATPAPTAARPGDVKPTASAGASATSSAVVPATATLATSTAEPPATVATQTAPIASSAASTASITSLPTATAPAVSALPPGTIDPKAVRATVRAHASEVQTCYDRAKLDTPDLKGRLTVEASVNATGRVQTARVAQTDVRSARLEGCIVSAFQGWTFPAPAGGVPGSVKYTFVFQD